MFNNLNITPFLREAQSTASILDKEKKGEDQKEQGGLFQKFIAQPLFKQTDIVNRMFGEKEGGGAKVSMGETLRHLPGELMKGAKATVSGAVKGLTLGYKQPMFGLKKEEQEAYKIPATVAELSTWLIPFGLATKGVTGAIKVASKIPSAAKIVAQASAKSPKIAQLIKSAAVGGATFGAVEAARKPEEGEDRMKMFGGGALIGAAFPFLGAGLKKVVPKKLFQEVVSEKLPILSKFFKKEVVVKLPSSTPPELAKHYKKSIDDIVVDLAEADVMSVKATGNEIRKIEKLVQYLEDYRTIGQASDKKVFGLLDRTWKLSNYIKKTDDLFFRADTIKEQKLFDDAQMALFKAMSVGERTPAVLAIDKFFHVVHHDFPTAIITRGFNLKDPINTGGEIVGQFLDYAAKGKVGKSIAKTIFKKPIPKEFEPLAVDREFFTKAKTITDKTLKQLGRGLEKNETISAGTVRKKHF